jgi:GGDEF domain-containing protein
MSPVSELSTVPNYVDLLTLSPAEYSQALTQLYGHRSVRSLCDAAVQLGTAALGPTLVALWRRRGASDHLLLAATVSLGQTAWPAVARELALPRAYAVFQEHRGQPVGGLSVSSMLARLTDCHEAIASSTAETTLASVAFVERDGLLAGVTLVAIQSEAPLAALHALSGHTAAAMRQLLSVDPAGPRRHRDPATGLLTRTGLEERAAREIVRAARYGRPLTLLVVKPGSSDGATMRVCARVLQDQLRDLDILARFDERHLAAMLPETDAHGGQLVVDRLRERLLAVGADIGLAAFPDDGRTWDLLKAHAVAAGCGSGAYQSVRTAPSPTSPSSTPPSTPITDRFPAPDGEQPNLRRLFPRL